MIDPSQAGGRAAHRQFKSKEATAEILGAGDDEPLRFATLPPITVEGVTRFGPPAAGDSCVLAVDESTKALFAFNARTYDVRWIVKAADFSSHNAPAIFNGFVIQHVRGAPVTGRRLDDGTEAWRIDSTGPWFPSGDFLVTSYGDTGPIRLFDPIANRIELEFDKPLPRVRGVTGRIAVLCGRATDTSGLQPNRNPFAAIDLRNGRELWRKNLGPPELDNMTAQPAIEAIRDGVIVVATSPGRLQGISVETGEIAWEAQAPRGAIFRAGRYFWSTSYEEQLFEILDVATGEFTTLKIKRGSGAGAFLTATFDDYVVSFATKGIYFFHRTRPHQRLPLKTTVGSCTGVQSGDDLLLREDGRLRPIRCLR